MVRLIRLAGILASLCCLCACRHRQVQPTEYIWLHCKVSGTEVINGEVFISSCDCKGGVQVLDSRHPDAIVIDCRGSHE